MNRFTGLAENIFPALIIFLLVTLVPAPGHAVDGSRLKELMYELASPVVDISAAYRIENFVLSHRDLEVHFDSGELVMLKPVMIDDTSHTFGAIFRGQGQFRFQPPVQMEWQQLARFYNSDTLNRKFTELLLLFNDSLHGVVISAGTSISIKKEKPWRKSLKNQMKLLTKNDRMFRQINLLKNIVYPRRAPYLLVMTVLDKDGRTVYYFDPYKREEIRLSKHFQYYGTGGFLETVCSYSILLDTTYRLINGIDREELAPIDLNIDMTIKRSGEVIAIATCKFEVKSSPLQLIKLYLNEELVIDSVLDGNNLPVIFYRHKKDKYKNSELYIFPDKRLQKGDSLQFVFYYKGNIAMKNLVDLYIDDPYSWYPTFFTSARSTFDLTFRSPKGYQLVATGRLVESKTVDRTVVTRWVCDTPVKDVSFNIGVFEKTSFKWPETPAVEVYYSEYLHQQLDDYYVAGKDMDKQVAEDILNSAKLFGNYFGPCPHDTLRVSEILPSHGRAYPGYILLAASTWINTDSWGHDRLFRAHETAHQWWGAGVGTKTYHDLWLSEAFADYSALMYLQAAVSNDQFMDRLKEYQDRIFSARKYIFGSGAESGAIALGSRTSTTKTAGDYGLIVYEKGAYVLHMLRNLLLDLQTMNDDRFLNLMRDWYATFRGKEATTWDFKQMVEKHVGMDMTWFFDQWVYGNDLPTYEFSYDIEQEQDSTYRAYCKLTVKDVPETFKMYIPIDIEFENGKHYYIRLLVDQLESEFDLPPIADKVKKLTLNPFFSVLAKVKQ